MSSPQCDSPSALMLLDIMRLSRPNIAATLRLLSRQAANAFSEYANENDDRVCYFITTEVDPDVVDPIIARGPLMTTRPLPTPPPPATSAGVSSHRMEISIVDALEQFGGVFSEHAVLDTMAFHINCTPWLLCTTWRRVSEIYSSLRRNDGDWESGFEAVPYPSSLMPHQCEKSSGLERRAPVCVTLMSPPLHVHLRPAPSGCKLTIAFTVGTANSMCALDECAKCEEVLFNTLPSGLVDLHMGPTTIDIMSIPPRDALVANSQRALLDRSKACDAEASAERSLEPFAATPASIASCFSSLPERRRVGACTHRCAVPENAICPTCSQIPVPIVWSIGPRFFASPELNGSIALNDGETILDLSGITNVFNFGDSFCAHSTVTEVILPRVISRDVLSGGLTVVTSGREGPGSAVTWEGEDILTLINDNLSDMSIPVGMVSMPLGPRSTFSSPCIVFSSVGSGFLQQCRYLHRLDLTPLTGVVTIGPDFMLGCQTIESLCLEPLQHVTQIGPRFLEGCSSLRALDFSLMNRLRVFPTGFLRNCSALAKIKLPTDISITNNAEKDTITIQGEFMCGCSKIEEVDFRCINTSIVFERIWMAPLKLFDRCYALTAVHFNSKSTTKRALAAIPKELHSKLGIKDDDCHVM